MATRGRRWIYVAGVAWALSAAGSALAQARPADPAAAAEPSSADRAAAAQHFETARALYLKGSYRDALAELQIAHKLDPRAKDLVFNLGVVHEKLTNIDDAIVWFKRYSEMDLTPAERGKVDGVLRRLEGAKRELEEKRRQQAASAPPPTAPKVAPERGREMGRLDPLTIGAGAVGGLGLVLGAVFAVKATSERPPSGFVTGRDGSYADLRAKVDAAHSAAIVADVAFGVAIVGGVGSALLYFLRPKQDDRAREPRSTSPGLASGEIRGVRVEGTAGPGAAGLVVRGAF